MKKNNKTAMTNRLRPDVQTAEAFSVWFDSSYDAIFIYTLSDQNMPQPFLVANQAAQEKFGCDLKQFRQMTLLDILAPEERREKELLLGGLFEQSLSNFEAQTVASDGSVIWVSVRSYAFHGQEIRNVISVVTDITDLKEAERGLLQRTSELEAVFRALPDLYFRVSLDGTILDWRAGRASDLFVPPEEFMGRRMQEVLPASVAAQLNRALAEIASGKSIAVVEYELPIKDVTQHFLGRVLPFMEDQAVLVVENVTERRNAETQLEEREKRYRLLAENARDMIYRISAKPEAHFEYMSPSAYTMIGYTPEDFYADPELGFKVVHPDDWHVLDDMTGDGTGKPKPVSVRLVRKDGEMVWTEQLNVPVYDENGELVALEGIARDITERKLAEEAVQIEKAFTESALNSLTDIFYAFDLDGRVTRWNKALNQITGYSDEEIAQRQPADYFMPEGREQVNQVMAETLGGHQTTVEGLLITKDGQRIPYEFTGSPLRNSAGEVIGLCGVGRDITERKLAEQALSRQERFSEDLLDNMGVGFVANDIAGKKVFVNQAFEKMTGYAREELVGQTPPYAYWPEEHVEAITAAFTRAQSGEPGPWDLVFKRKNGEPFNTLVTTGHMQTEQGETIVTATFKDITERKRAEETLRLSENRYKAIVEDQTELVSRFQADGTVTFCNEACSRFSHLSREEMIGRDFYRFLPPEEAQRVKETIAALSPESPTNTVEVRVISGEGRRVWMLWTNRAIFDDQGSIVDIQAVGRDISSRKRIQDRLELLNSCFLSLGPDPHENISKIMQAGLQILGGAWMKYCRPEKGRTLTCSTLYPHQGFVAKMGTGGCSLWERAIENEGGPLIIEDMSDIECGTCDPVFAEHGIRSFMGTGIRLAGDTIGCLGLTDSRVRAWDQEEREIFMMISKAVAIEEERWASEENLRDFIDIASHELRHPITIMKGYAIALETLDEQLDMETKRNALQAIDQAADRLNRLVGELLNISRIEKGRFSILKEEVPLRPLIQQAVSEMHSRAGEERFNLEIAPELGTLRVDPVKLAQLLVILLDNAVKFSPPESPIDIEASVYDGDLLVSVKDRGSGIPMTETRKVFERFYQLEDALHHSSQGIGLGLYIAKKIVEAHGGEIWCELREGGGSVFSFILP